MLTLLLMRHAKSSWDVPGLSDFDRPLNKRGRQAAPRMARHLAGEGLVPDVIFCSTAVRTRETVDLMLPLWNNPPRVEYLDDLYHGSPSDFVTAVHRLGETDSLPMVLSHNPGMQLLITHWAHHPVRFPTGAVARFDFDLGHWSELDLSSQATLHDVWRPRELPDVDEPTRHEESA